VLLSSVGALAGREELEFSVALVVERSNLLAAQGAFSFSYSRSIHLPILLDPLFETEIAKDMMAGGGRELHSL